MYDGAVDVGRRVEHVPAHAAGDTHAARKLRGDGERSVVLAAGRRDHAFGDFLLHHHGDGKAVRIVQKAEQHGRGYVVGQVGYGFVRDFGREIALHEVAERNGDVRVRLLERQEIFFEPFVYLVSADARPRERETKGERAHARAHFHGGIARRQLRVRRDSR